MGSCSLFIISAALPACLPAKQLNQSVSSCAALLWLRLAFTPPCNSPLLDMEAPLICVASIGFYLPLVVAHSKCILDLKFFHLLSYNSNVHSVPCILGANCENVLR